MEHTKLLDNGVINIKLLNDFLNNLNLIWVASTLLLTSYFKINRLILLKMSEFDFEKEFNNQQ